MVELAPLSNTLAREYFEKNSAFRGDFSLAIAAREGDTIHGVVAFHCDGNEFVKRHIFTDGNAQIGSLLYGAMVRVAMALGYKQLTL